METGRTVGLLGLGLIGGSLAHALKRKGPKYRIVGWNRARESLIKACEDGVVDVAASDGFDEFGACDIVFLCVPAFAMGEMLERLLPKLKPDCVITDVGSTKGDVMSIIEDVGASKRFIGGHPLAGSEQTGYSAAKANLFENAYYILTHDETVRKEHKDLLMDVIADIGAIPLEMDAAQHDRVTAAISHVPHVVAALLVNLVKKLDGPEQHMKTIAAGGFKDITRIASSSPELWTGICLSNRECVLKTLDEMESMLALFKRYLADKDSSRINDYFEAAKNYRNSFSGMPKSLIQRDYTITVDVEDKPGIIATIAAALAEKQINIKNIGINNSRENDEGALEIRFENDEAVRNGIEALRRLGYQAKARQ
jgi:prephenate dehydrogenase